MTTGYWLRIIAGVAVIFLIGLGVQRGIARGKSFVVDHVPSSFALMQHSGFRLDGDKLGDIERLQFMRSEPGHVDSAVITLRVDDSSDVDRFSHCIVRVKNGYPFASNTTFACADADDSAHLQLVPFGHLTLTPGETAVPIFVAREALGSYQLHAYRGAGSDSGDIDIKAAGDSMVVTVNGTDLVRINGSDKGGSLVVRGPDGKPLLEVHGDSAGGSLKVMDKDGNTKVNIHGGNRRGHDSF